MKMKCDRVLKTLVLLLAITAANAQCPTIICPADINQTNISGTCEAVVSYTPPEGQDFCSGGATFTYTGAIQNWVVPAGVTLIHIEASGASGGSGNGGGYAGGKGAIMAGDFAVTPGQTLQVVVGGAGQNGAASMGGGGGGGSFVYVGAIGGAGLMIVAGGGGGGGEEWTTGGCDARTDEFSTGFPNGCNALLADGSGGAGGNNYGGGGGAGWLSDGVDYGGWPNSGGDRWAGGVGQQSNGGFGGGGGCHDGGGAGGGYTGGPGGNNGISGGGAGGSYNIGINQANLTGHTGNGEVSISYTLPGFVTTTMISGLGSGATFPLGTTVETYQVVNILGDTTTCSFNVIISDTGLPVPILAFLPDLMDECSINAVAPLAIDNCDDTVTATTLDPTSYSDTGTYVINWTFSDGSGNTVNQLQNVIITDSVDPVPDLPSLPDIVAQCSVSATAPTATDNCGGVITGTTTDSVSYSSQGTFLITWSYDDSHGNIVYQAQNIIIDDTLAPVPDVPSLPDIITQCSVSVTSPTATDNCSGVLTGTTTDSTSYVAQGNYVITWTYDDGHGNTTQQLQNVIIDDTMAPVPDVAQLPDIIEACSAVVTPPTATDSCEGIITGTTTDSTTYNSQGSYIITWTYDDGNGNTSQQLQNVIIDDTLAPVPDVALLPDITDECSASVTPPTATDYCEGIITGTTTDSTSYNVQGNYVITWTYDDGNGNTSQQLQNVYINDTTGPLFDCLLSVVSCDGTADSIAPVNVSDNCGIVTVTYTLTGATSGSGNDDASSEIFNVGVTTVTYSFDDGNGNMDSCSFDVIYDSINRTVIQSGNTLYALSAGTYQWYNCDSSNIIPGETGQGFTFSHSGNYAVIITMGSCTDTSLCHYASGTGMGELQGHNLKVYPNPTKDIIDVEWDGCLPAVVTITDMMGQLILKEQQTGAAQFRLDLGGLSEGLYFVVIECDGRREVLKLLKNQ